MAVEEASYRLVGRRAEGRFTLLSQQLAAGGRAALVFHGTVAAETFRIVEGLEEGWEVIEGATVEIANLLAACAATGAALFTNFVCRRFSVPRMNMLQLYLSSIAWNPYASAQDRFLPSF